MLYNPKWEKTMTNPFALSTLIDWLERQPASQHYNYGSPCRCLLAQYFTAHGFADVTMGTRYFSFKVRKKEKAVDLPPDFDYIASAGPHTFAAALDRARAIAEPLA